MASIMEAFAPSAELPTPPQPALEMRAFGDSTATRNKIFSNALAKAQTAEPVSNQLYTLALGDLKYEGAEKYTRQEQKRAILRGDTLSRRLRGTWRLLDKETGEEVSKKRSTVAQVPYLTNRGTFILGGNEYTLANQLRLRAGVYTRVKENGELESHVNVMPGKGISHRINMDPESGVFRLNVGQSNIPLMPVLRAMGATDERLREMWGNELYSSNMQKDDPKAINKLYEKIVRNQDPQADRVSKMESIAEAFDSMELDEKVTERTLGAPFKTAGLETMLATTSKLLNVSRGVEEVDDRDHLAYQTLHGPEDLIGERVGTDRARLRQLLWRATARKNLDNFPVGVFTKNLQAAIMSSGLGQPLEEINPADIFDHQSRVSRLGEGGIPDIRAVPDEARNVQPSHFGFIDPVRTPESFKIGVDSRISYAAKKGSDGRLYAPFRDMKTGDTVYKAPQDLSEVPVAFPGELKKPYSHVAAMIGGRTRYVDRRKIKYEMPHFEQAFSALGAMVPMKSTVKAQRMSMASRMFTQALPLLKPEAPLVQSGTPGKKGMESFEELFSSNMGAVRSDDAGTVTKISPTGVTLRLPDGATKDVELYENFPYNRKTFLHNTPVVRVGDQVTPGQLLARSNFTDEKGVTALGLNARVAYIPFKGMNFEDAIVISKSMAKRLSSEHAYQHGQEWEKNIEKGRDSYVSIFPSVFDKKAMETIDDDGVVKKGTRVKAGDPLVLVAQRKERTADQVHRSRRSFSDKTQTWKHHSPGIVTDVEKTDKGVHVVVKSTMPMQIGDKLSGRYGDKGIISGIMDDGDMPKGEDGSPFEVLLNPLGIISRTNPAQMIEAALGKIAVARGAPYKIPDFEDVEDMTEYAIDELRRHGLKDMETVNDPDTGRKIKNIFTGNRFFMKLHHTAEGKGQGRGVGNYTADKMPAKGGETGAKRVGMLEVNALLSHGATEVLRDAGLVRGQENPEYWQQFMSGFKPPTPKVPWVYRKFVNQLKGSGINVVREGRNINIMAMTDHDVTSLAGKRELTNVGTVNWKGKLEPTPGGLFDETLTGGHGGDRWSYIKLHEPLPNPVMEEPIRRLLGLTEKKMQEVISGKEAINGRTGPKAIAAALSSINIDNAIEQARMDVKAGKKTLRDAAVRKLGYLKAAQKTGIHPREWMWSKVPVLPPAFRPVSVMQGNNLPMISDPNYLYKEVFEANESLTELAGELDDVGDERLNVYKALKAVTGLGHPTHPKNQERKVKGILRHVFGSSPKLGTVQRRLLGGTVDLVGRAVIAPNPDLDMDHVALPENHAWDLYKPFIVRNMVRRGLPRLRAASEVQTRSENAREALLEEMEARPVMITRAPALHRYSIMAAWPRLTKNNVMEISPLVVGGFNADFDGDAMNYHVPATDEAVKDAIDKMLPSRNLFAANNFKVHYKPSQEYVGGLYAASTQRDMKNAPRVFQNKAAAIRAYRRGEIEVGRRIEIIESE